MQQKIWLFLVLGVLLTACATNPSPPPLPTATPTPVDTPTPEPADTPTPVFSSNPFNDGMAARRNGDYARAVAAFQLVLKSNPAADPSTSAGQVLAQETQYRVREA